MTARPDTASDLYRNDEEEEGERPNPGGVLMTKFLEARTILIFGGNRSEARRELLHHTVCFPLMIPPDKLFVSYSASYYNRYI